MSEISEYVKAVEDYQQIVHRRLWIERVCWLIFAMIIFILARKM